MKKKDKSLSDAIDRAFELESCAWEYHRLMYFIRREMGERGLERVISELGNEAKVKGRFAELVREEIQKNRKV